MKSLWNSFCIAFAMFSRIPVPRADWSQKNMRYMMCFFPFIGIPIGVLTWFAYAVGHMLDLKTGFLAALLVLVPVAVTGGIHIDGLLDTADALSSWQERSRRLEILKDSHAGAFAVITCSVYFLLYYGVYCQMGRRALPVVCISFCLSRTLSGLAVVTFPKAREDGTVAEFSKNAQTLRVRNVLVVYLVLLGAGLLVLDFWLGIAALLAGGGAFWFYHHKAMKYFGGTTGDLAGYFLSICELAIAVVTVAAECVLRSVGA